MQIKLNSKFLRHFLSSPKPFHSTRTSRSPLWFGSSHSCSARSPGLAAKACPWHQNWVRTARPHLCTLGDKTGPKKYQVQQTWSFTKKSKGPPWLTKKRQKRGRIPTPLQSLWLWTAAAATLLCVLTTSCTFPSVTCRIAERQVHCTVTGLPLATCDQMFPELRLTVVTSAGPYSAEKHCLFGFVINERSVLSHWSKASDSICQGSPWLAKKNSAFWI